MECMLCLSVGGTKIVIPDESCVQVEVTKTSVLDTVEVKKTEMMVFTPHSKSIWMFEVAPQVTQNRKAEETSNVFDEVLKTVMEEVTPSLPVRIVKTVIVAYRSSMPIADTKVVNGGCAGGHVN